METARRRLIDKHNEWKIDSSVYDRSCMYTQWLTMTACTHNCAIIFKIATPKLSD